MSISPYETLGLPSNSTPEELKARYRTLDRQQHPDHGVAPGALQVVVTAYKKALKITLAKPCPECYGQGKVLKQSGWIVLKVDCKSCKGLGKKFK